MPGPPDQHQTKELQVNRITEVFKTVGLPEYTYVEPDIYEDIIISIETPGKHLLLQGPSGSGKTCLIRRILSDLRLGEKKDYIWLSALEEDCQEKAFELASSAIAGQQKGIVVVDDVHLLSADARSQLAKQLKQLSDKAYNIESPAMFILIGIPTTAESMLLNTTDLGPRIEIRKMPPAREDQLLRLIHEGERRLAIQFSRPKSIVAEANNSFCLCQNICLSTCRVNGIRETQEDVAKVSFQKAKSHRFLPLLISFCKQGEIQDGEKNPFLLIVKAIAGIKKSVIRLPEILAQSDGDADVIQKCKGRIKGSMDAAEGSETFLKLFHYDEQVEVFSIEHPMFRYYLNYMDISAVTASLGI